MNFKAHVGDKDGASIVFGMQISHLDVAGVARRIADRSPHGPGARLFVTPNIQHVSLMRRDSELRDAMESAELVTCDGFPVARYARYRGAQTPGRVTGREVVDELMNHTDIAGDHRLFFLVDNDETAAAVHAWAAPRDFAVAVEIAPMGFGKDHVYCAELADRIAGFGATILFLGVGAPRSELFAARYRYRLPDGCWALCIGQSIKIALGLVVMPPAPVRALNVEWLWRLLLEPKRLIGRYCDGGVGFALSVYDEVRESSPPPLPRRDPAERGRPQSPLRKA